MRREFAAAEAGRGVRPWACERSASGQFDLLDAAYTMQGGISGPGGKGGDGEDIFVGLINTDSKSFDDAISEISKTSTVAGGAPGPNGKYLTPSTRGTYPANGNRCSFHRLSSDQDYSLADNGKAGLFRSEVLTAPIALSRITQLLNAKSARTDYDLFTVAQLSRIDPNIRSTQPSGALDQYLSRTLANAEVKFLEDLDRVLGLGTTEQLGYLPETLQGISQISLDNVPFQVSKAH